MPISITSVRSEDVDQFREILQECDVQLGNGEDRHKIVKPQSLVIRELEKKLSGNLGEFLSGVKNVFSDEEELVKALMPTLYRPPGETNSIEQESLCRMLLNVKPLQNSVVDLLLEKLTSICSEESIEDATLLRLILKAFRFLPFINEPAQFTSRILDLIEISIDCVQREILNSVPDLIPDNQYDEAAKQLSELLEEHDELSGLIIDCLNSFNISPEARFNIQQYIIERLLTSTRYYNIFPILFEFLITDCKQEKMVGILLKTRETMDNIMSAESTETVSYKAIIFRRLEILSIDRKFLCESFVTMINSHQAGADHKPIDVLLLFMLHSSCKGKKKLIETVFKKRIKNSMFKIVLFERIFEKYFVQQTFDDYFNSILEIAGLLLRTTDNQAVEIAEIIYKLLFTNKLCSRIQRQDLLYNLMMMIGMRDSKHTSAALKVLHALLEAPTIHEHAVQLKGLLEKIDVLDLSDIKMVFEIVCSVTCGEKSEQYGLKDEVHIFIVKLLSSYEKSVRQKGIISAVILAKHIATVSEVVEINLDETFDTLEDLPETAAKEAAKLLIIAHQCAMSIQEILGLYYDQLSLMIIDKSELDPYFLSWLFETITRDFQETFLVEEPLSPINDLKLTPQYLVNTESEFTSFMAINIGEMAIKERFMQNSKIVILAPLFKLFRLLHYKRFNGDLSSIDALIGLPVIMPEFKSVDDLHQDQIKQVMDCIYHCINWFRELISAFSSQTLKRIRAKVMERLMELIKLEETLQECLDCAPEHKLPISSFDGMLSQASQQSPVKNNPRGSTKGPPRKKLKSAATINDTLPCTSTSAVATQITKPKRRTQKTELNIKFREMDTDIIILLKYPLTISRSTSTPSTTLHLKQFQFLLKDLIYKLDVLTSNKVSSLSNLNKVDPVNLITDCRKLFPVIQKQNVVIVHELEKLLEQVDDRHDLPELFTEEAEDLKTSYSIILQLYSIIFRWSGFQHTKHQTLLKDCLKPTLNADSSETFIPLSKYINDFSCVITKSVDQCLLLSSAVKMIDVIEALYKIRPEPELRRLIVTTSEKFLKRKWFNVKGKPETGKQNFVNIDLLIKAYLSDADVKTICELVGTLQDEVPNLKSREDYLLMLNSIDRMNFHIFYRGLCTVLLERVKQEIVSLTNNEHLKLWKTTALTMQGLITIVKIHNSKSNLSFFFKKSIGVLNIFLSHGIPIMEIMFTAKKDTVVEIFKIIQITTRFLHFLCCYSKKIKDFNLISLVPHFRSTLEKLIYRVKATLSANNCSDEFWMGNLKNKDLQGDDILSQSTVSESSLQDEEEEELPVEESDDEDLLLRTNNEEHDTASEVFDLDN